MATLEHEILASMLEYSDKIDSFLSLCPKECFSKQGSELLGYMLELLENNNLSKASFLSVLPDTLASADFTIEVLSTLPNSNFVASASEFIKLFQLQEQKVLGEKLLQASANKTLLDFDTLYSKTTMLEYKTMRQWRELYAQKGISKKFKTGLDFLDSVFEGGIAVGQLVLISGDPEAGKTTLGVQILEYIAKEHKVAFFCFEFTINQYLSLVKKTGRRINENNFFIINDGYDINTLAQNIKNLYRQGVQFFLIDSQMRITTPQARNMEEEESSKFSTLARLAHRLDIVIMLIIQTSKSDRDNPMGSKKGGHESSITIRIEHTDSKTSEFNEQERFLIIKKNKQTGKHYKEKVIFDNEKTAFVSLVRHLKPTKTIEYKEVLDMVKI